MSKLKLINILKNKILEQAPIGFYDTDEEPGVYYTSDEETGKIEKVDANAIESEFYDENTTYEEDALLGYHERAKKDRDEGITNPNLISDVIKALKIANISAEIHYSRDGHDKYTSNGNISRHWVGNAVDLSVIDGVGNKGGVVANKGLCCPTSEKFMSGGDKIVAALESLGYKSGEGGNTKAYIWRSQDHYNHVHVSRTDRPSSKNKKETETKKDEDGETDLDGGEKKTISKSSYIIDLNNPKSKNIGLVWGGTPSSTYGASFMKKQGENYFTNKNIIYSDHENSLSDIKKFIKKELGDGYTINSVSGFSKGAEKTWGEINGDYDFVGLIDPSTSIARTSLPSNVKMMSNHSNWSYYPDMLAAIKTMEKSGLSERVGDNKTYNHLDIPKIFFEKYSSSY